MFCFIEDSEYSFDSKIERFYQEHVRIEDVLDSDMISLSQHSAKCYKCSIRSEYICFTCEVTPLCRTCGDSHNRNCTPIAISEGGECIRLGLELIFDIRNMSLIATKVGIDYDGIVDLERFEREGMEIIPNIQSDFELINHRCNDIILIKIKELKSQFESSKIYYDIGLKLVNEYLGLLRKLEDYDKLLQAKYSKQSYEAGSEVYQNLGDKFEQEMLNFTTRPFLVERIRSDNQKRFENLETKIMNSINNVDFWQINIKLKEKI